METTEGYRKARGKHSIVAAVSIAWGAAQIDIGSFSIAGVTTSISASSTVAAGIFILLMYVAARAVIEYMMQSLEVRRWRLAQWDFHLSLNLFRVAFFIIAVSTISRDQETAARAILGFALSFVSFGVIFVFIYILFSLVYVPIRTMNLKRSAASAVFRSMAYSIGISILMVAVLIIDQILQDPFLPFIPRFLPKTASLIETLLIGFVMLLLLFSFVRGDIFLRPIFAYVPMRIGKNYTENGKHYYKEDWNPDHPDYEELKANDRFSGPLVVEELTNDEVDK